jgi:hypothetical protein
MKMKNLVAFYWLATGFVTILFLTGCDSSAAENEEHRKVYVHVPPTMPDSVYQKLEEGDIIMRKGTGPLSFHIMNATKEDYSHCGVIVKHEGEWSVIHSMGGSVSKNEDDGMQMTTVKNFVEYAADSMLFICRAEFEDSLGPKIRDRAYHYLEEDATFDHAFNLYSEDEIYCSELIFKILRDVTGSNQMRIRKQHKSYILLFETFFDESKYQPIFHLKDLQE